MNQPRSSTKVFDAVATDTDASVRTVSEVVNLGQMTTVMVMILNGGNTTSVDVTIEVAPGGQNAGRNGVPTDDAHWFYLDDRTVGPNSEGAFSFFGVAAPFMRLTAVSGTDGQSTPVTAYVDAAE